jgi:hypothetical protein
MKRTAVVAAGVAVLGIVGVPSASTATAQSPRLAAPPATLVQYGYVRSLVRSGNGYRMRFDPAFWLSGQTANRAAIEDGVIARGETVPNDYYIRNESRRQLTYTVLPRARVTIVTNSAVGGLRATRISASELRAIVAGRNPRRRAIYGRDLGYWIRIAVDRVTRLDQQYQP